LIDAGGDRPRVVVFLDADHSDHAELLPVLVEPILTSRADFVLGSRRAGERETRDRPSRHRNLPPVPRSAPSRPRWRWRATAQRVSR
jgi:hypothetical protein